MGALLRGAAKLKSFAILGLFVVSIAWLADALAGGGAAPSRQTLYAAAAGFCLALTAVSFVLNKQISLHGQLSRRYVKLLSTIDQFPYGVIVFSRNSRLVHANHAYCDMYGLDRGDLPAGMEEIDVRQLRRRKHLPVKDDAQKFKVKISETGPEVEIEIWPLSDGRMIQFEKIELDGGGWIALHRDVTEHIAQSRKLDETSRFLNSILENVPSAIIVKDAKTLRYEFVNHAAEKINGWRAQGVIGRFSNDFFSTEQAQRIDRRDIATFKMEDGAVSDNEEQFNTGLGEKRILNARRMLLRDANGDPSRLITVLEDLTAQREAEASTAFLAMHDALTGLYNRTWFNAKLDSLAARKTEGEPGEIALATIDLDGFKEVNDTFGHSAGDLILRHVAAQIHKIAGPDAQAARLGGDEFALVADVTGTPEATAEKLRGLIRAISESIDYDEHKISVRCSIGLAFAERGAFNPDDLYRQADMALYEAKECGKATLCVFHQEIAGKRLRMKSLEVNLRLAIDNDQFKLHFQPIFNTRSSEIVSMEALLRWQHPVHGLIPPSEFIPVAESSGLILPIGEIVIRKACEAAIRWPEHVRVSINLSPVQFRDLDLAGKIARILAQTGIKPSRLEIEITEATLLSDDADSLKTLNALRATGVRIVMDDFGTGYSSLNYIRSFPFDKIKIDKSYVDDLSRASNKSNVILHAVLSMARVLDLATTAEGVETAEQAEQLRNEGCTELQGYFFSRPLTEEDALALFDKEQKVVRLRA